MPRVKPLNKNKRYKFFIMLERNSVNVRHSSHYKSENRMAVYVKNFKLSKLISGKWLGESVNVLSEWLGGPGKGTLGS